MTLDSTPPEGTERDSLGFDDIEDTSVFETRPPRTADEHARYKAYKRRQRRDAQAVAAVVRAVKRVGWKLLAAISLPIAIEVVRLVLDWLAHR